MWLLVKVEEKGIDTRDRTDTGGKPAAVCKPTAFSETNKNNPKQKSNAKECLKGNNVYDLDQTKHIEKP